MDKYINGLFIRLSQKYNVSLVTILSYNEEDKRSYKTMILKIKKGNKLLLDFTSYSKRMIILEMAKWVTT